jgi:hypothetical protein
MAALTLKVAPGATVTLLEPNALLLDATNIPLLVTIKGRLNLVLAPLNTKVPASATSVPFVPPEIVPDKTSVLPAWALKIFLAAPELAMAKLLVRETDVIAFVAHSLFVNTPKVVTPTLVVPILTFQA